MVWLLYNLGYVTCPVGLQTGNVGLSSMDKDAQLTSGLPSVNVAGVRGGS
jgi:hypothetical protein